MSSTKKKILGKVAEAFMKFVLRRLEGKTPEQVERTGTRYGRLMWKFAGKRRNKTIENLTLAFPEKSKQEILTIAEGVFIHFARSSTDFLSSGHRTKAEVESNTKIFGIEHLDAALAAGKGVILVTGHLGNWERMSAWLSFNGYQLSAVARDANDEGVNRIVNDIRRAPGTKIIPRGQAARQVLTKLKANEMVGLLADQNAYDIFIPFFGYPAGTALGLGVFHTRTKAPVIPMACFRVGPGQYEATFYPPLEPVLPESQSGEGIMLAYNQWLEARIREHPEQWLWMHDRWRHARHKGLM